MNPWHNARLMNALANIVFLLCAFAGLVTGLAWIMNRPYFAIHSVEVGPAPGQALRHVPQVELRHALEEGEYGSFFTIDMRSVRTEIEQVPWVRQATIRRIWPDKLVILIEEHRPFALWEDGRLINTYGEMFSANLDEAEADGPLPQLGGPDGTELKVARRYAELTDLVETLKLKPVSVNLSERLAWTARLDDGTDLLIGREQGVPVAERVARWVEAYPLVTERIQRRASLIDLRYPNGFSVRSLEKLADAFDIDDLIADVTKGTSKGKSEINNGNSKTNSTARTLAKGAAQ
ncbi:MAG: cell division protein FtsQ/DivIB [Burkholderiaceae bacterium]